MLSSLQRLVIKFWWVLLVLGERWSWEGRKKRNQGGVSVLDFDCEHTHIWNEDFVPVSVFFWGFMLGWNQKFLLGVGVLEDLWPYILILKIIKMNYYNVPNTLIFIGRSYIKRIIALVLNPSTEIYPFYWYKATENIYFNWKKT